MATTQRKGHGFALLSKEKRKQVASSGGKRAQKLGKAHRWTKQEASEAGVKGGTALVKKYGTEHMRELIRKRWDA